MISATREEVVQGAAAAVELCRSFDPHEHTASIIASWAAKLRRAAKAIQAQQREMRKPIRVMQNEKRGEDGDDDEALRALRLRIEAEVADWMAESIDVDITPLDRVHMRLTSHRTPDGRARHIAPRVFLELDPFLCGDVPAPTAEELAADAEAERRAVAQRARDLKPHKRKGKLRRHAHNGRR